MTIEPQSASDILLLPIVGLAVSTGMRRSEILGLRWLDLDRSRSSAMPALLPPAEDREPDIDAAGVIERILRHLKLWDLPKRSPPIPGPGTLHYDVQLSAWEDNARSFSGTE